ncbi:Nif11-like leader peptide family natural product precursor [Desulfosarcina sp.]|nr:Nif11-like leader peptide family natural product precursor [Desulfosarcina sp.]
MSKEDVRRAMGKLLSSKSFLASFKSDPRVALAGFDLTGEELGALEKLNSNDIASLDIKLEDDMDKNMKIGWFTGGEH